MRMRVVWSWLLISAAVISSASCGGDSDDDDASTGYVRLVNATEAESLSLTTASGTVVNSSVASGTASSYATLTSGNTYSVVVSAADASLSASATTSLTVSADVKYTAVAYQRGGVIKVLTLTDDESEPVSGFATLTAINSSTDAGTLDIYVVSPGSSLTDLSPVFSSLTGGNTSLAQSTSAGTYDIVVTANNKPSDVRLTIPSVSLESKEILTMVLTSTSGGTLVDGILIQQGGDVQVQRSNNARVRVTGAFPADGTTNSVISTVVAGKTLSSVTAPSVGTYSLVAADASEYSVSVDGVAVTGLPAATFQSGGDYTILVYGTSSSAPAVAVLTDNNQTPTSGAKIRLINAAVSIGGLSLSHNYVPLFSEVGFGAASEYSGVSSGTSLLQLTSPVSTFPSYTTTVSLTSGGVYSLFVLGTTTAPIEVLNRDK